MSERSETSPKVSIVLVTYNRAARLPATLDSLLAQTLSDFELIVSDDCSPDETEAVCRDYARRDPRVRYRRNERNLRMPGNLNAGIAEARGEYVAITHDGDVYRPDVIEKWAGALDRHASAGFVFNAYLRVWPGTDRPDRVERVEMPECMNGREFLRQIFVPNWGGCPIYGTAMIRRRCLDEVGLFDPRFSMHSDVEMWARLAGRYDVVYLPETLITLLPREPGHFLEDHYWWEKTVDVRVKRLALLGTLGARSWRERLPFELRARALYAFHALVLLKNRRWSDARKGALLVLTGREDVPPPS